MKIIKLLFLLSVYFAFGQNFTKKDTLLGSNTAYRDFWDVQRYDVKVEPSYEQKSLKGSNKITFKITKSVRNPVFQIDLQQPMKHDSIRSSFRIKSTKVDGNFIFLETKESFKKGQTHTLEIDFNGNPIIAENAPWDGGWVFTQDEKGNPWMSVACEGIGASVWLPIKEYWGDEPDMGMTLTITTPKDLMGVGNGRLMQRSESEGKNHFVWEVFNPINSYNIVPYIGKYVHFSDSYMGKRGKLDLDYWVLDYNLEKAKNQFKQVKPMLKAFEHWFGGYPFYKDGYKLVESPYLGMEHQSNVAYGNGYQNGYYGRDLSGTGVGMYWDFIIVHESGHEWFGNNITAQDKADMWIHEAFTTYSEVLFTENYMDKNAANTYIKGLRKSIMNDQPIIGTYGVRKMGSMDQYIKGANMIHTIRQVINNDEKFRQILLGMNTDFYHKIVTSKQVEDYISKKAGIDFSLVFDQYLRTTQIPQLEYEQKGNQLKFRWNNTIKNFRMPVKLKSHSTHIAPTQEWQTITLANDKTVEIDDNYYIDVLKK